MGELQMGGFGGACSLASYLFRQLAKHCMLPPLNAMCCQVAASEYLRGHCALAQWFALQPAVSPRQPARYCMLPLLTAMCCQVVASECLRGP